MNVKSNRSIFELVAKSDAKYFLEGQYLVELIDAKLMENTEGRIVAVIDFRVDKCSNPKIKIGEVVTWICRLQGSDVGPRELKTQFCRIVNCRPNQVSAETLENSFTADPKTGVSPLSGRQCYAYSHLVKTSQGGQFIKVEFLGITANTPAPYFEQATAENTSLKDPEDLF